MNEDLIAAKVAENIPSNKPPVEAVQKTETEPGEPAVHTHLEYDTNLGLQLSDYFGLDKISRHTEDTQIQLRQIYKWAAQLTNSTEVSDVFYAVRTLEEQLGITYKPNRLQRLSRWVEIDQKTKALRTQQEMIVNG